MKILIIDDDALVVRALARMLRAHEVLAATSAKEALAMIRAGRNFDVILCDLNMPGMTGRELYLELEECAPDEAARVVFTSGGACNAVDAAFAQTRPVVMKPFDKAALSRALMRWLPLLPPLRA